MIDEKAPLKNQRRFFIMDETPLPAQGRLIPTVRFIPPEISSANNQRTIHVPIVDAMPGLRDGTPGAEEVGMEVTER